MIYCPNCERHRGFKRSLGFGTLFAVVLSCGLWLLAIPFYPARCVVCGLTRSRAFTDRLSMKQRTIILVCVMLFLIFCAIHGASR